MTAGVRILVFTEGTLLIDGRWAGLPREEMVHRSRSGQGSGDFSASIPVGEAVAKLQTWRQQGAAIAYLTSRTRAKEVEAIRTVLDRYVFPEGRLWFRRPGEQYKDVAERVRPHVLVEDDCESIGGEAQMTYPHIRPDVKTQIVSIVVKEFGGIDHLPDDITALAKRAKSP